MKHNNKYIWLDLIRGISALIVLFSHLRTAMFVDFNQAESKGILSKMFYLVTGLGHEAVMVFFVLSGFFVGGSCLLKADTFTYKRYFIARLSRLWIVLVPALFFTLGIDLYIQSIDPTYSAGAYLTVSHSGPDQNYSIAADTFWANVFFVQTIYAPVYGSNVPFWSLANEFWYYCLFPLMFFSWIKRENILISSFFIALILSQLDFSQNFGYAIWLLGLPIFLFYQKENTRLSSYHVLISGSLLFFALALSKSHKISLLQINEALVALSFTYFLCSVKDRGCPDSLRKIVIKVSTFLSNISYTVYLFHFPLVMLIFINFYSKERLQLSLTSVCTFLLAVFVIVIFSHVMWLLFEKHSLKFRRFIEKILA